VKKTLFIILFYLAIAEGRSQSMAGITGKPDTSFTINSAYASVVKKHPEIKIIRESDLASVREKKNITYCRTGKRKLVLDAFFPKQHTKLPAPAILIIHGGGWRTGNRSQHYPMAQRLADLGYVCFTPEYRLSTEALYPAAVYDIKAALRWIRSKARKYNIDTAGITVLGFSAGGELAAFMGSTNGNSLFEGSQCNLKYSSAVRAVIDIDGILSFVHPESGEGDDSKRISAATHWFGYGKKDNPALWEQASALTHTGKNTPPTLFINSSVARMHAGRDDYIKILNRYNTYTEVRVFEDAPHEFCLFDPWFEPTIKYIDEFMKKVFPK
jgi:pectinesterase